MKKTLIERIEVGSGGQTVVTFSSIPQTYTDLYLVGSTRSDTDDSAVYLRPNGSTANSSNKRLYGTGTSAGSTSTVLMVGGSPGPAQTANTFSNWSAFIPNYTSSNGKSISADAVNENNASSASQNLNANLWNNAAAITYIELQTGGDFVQYSSFSLYGITAGNDGTTTVS